MPQTRSRLFDDFSKLMTDAAGLAEGARREVETLANSQLERVMASMDVVSREEFEAVREMAAKARAENERLEARIAALEARLGNADAAAHSLEFPNFLIPLEILWTKRRRRFTRRRESENLRLVDERWDM